MSCMLRRESEQEARRRLRTTRHRMSAVLEKLEECNMQDSANTAWPFAMRGLSEEGVGEARGVQAAGFAELGEGL